MSQDKKSNAAAPLFLTEDTSLQQIDRELHELHQTFKARADTARHTARTARARGDLVKWRRANAVAAAWNEARSALEELGCPF